MRTQYNNRTRKYRDREYKRNARDPRDQNFDNLDASNEFTSIKVINEYRRMGEALMRSDK